MKTSSFFFFFFIFCDKRLLKSPYFQSNLWFYSQGFFLVPAFLHSVAKIHWLSIKIVGLREEIQHTKNTKDRIQDLQILLSNIWIRAKASLNVHLKLKITPVLFCLSSLLQRGSFEHFPPAAMQWCYSLRWYTLST